MTRFFDSMTCRDETCRDRLAARVIGGLGLAGMNVLAAVAGDFSRAGRRMADQPSASGRAERRVMISHIAEVSLSEALSDPIVRSLMAADRVDPTELEACLDKLATKLKRRRANGAAKAG